MYVKDINFDFHSKYDRTLFCNHLKTKQYVTFWFTGGRSIEVVTVVKNKSDVLVEKWTILENDQLIIQRVSNLPPAL